MWLSKYFVYFIVYSFMGWIFETTYCTVTKKSWDNRGFLYGPVCPIYGVGAVSITIIVDSMAGKIDYTWWQVFIISFFGSIVLEYITSWGLEKLFHAYWWDYSDLPFNINGRVCLPCSIGFGVGGIVVVYLILPLTRKILSVFSPLGLEGASLFFMAVFAADFTLTVSALTHFEKSILHLENSLNEHMSNFVDGIEDGSITASTVIESGKLAVAEKLENGKQAVSDKIESGKQAVAEKIESGKQAVSDKIESGKQAVSDKFEDKREQYFKEKFDSMYYDMEFTSKMALRKVKGYRPRKNDTGRMNTALQLLKEQVYKKKE